MVEFVRFELQREKIKVMKRYLDEQLLTISILKVSREEIPLHITGTALDHESKKKLEVFEKRVIEELLIKANRIKTTFELGIVHGNENLDKLENEVDSKN